MKNEVLDSYAGEIMSALALSHIIGRTHVPRLDDCRVRQPHELLVISKKLNTPWRKARTVVGLPDNFRFYDLRHTGHTLSTRSRATLKDTMVRAGQSSEKAAMIYQHSEEGRQQEVAGMLDQTVRKARRAVARKPDDQASGTEVARDA